MTKGASEAKRLKAIKKAKGPARQPTRASPSKRLKSLSVESARAAAATTVELSETMITLSAYIARALKISLPKDVTERAKLHLLDALAAMISGSRLLPGRRVIDYIKTLGGTKEACVVGTRIMTTAINAALANGIFGHADETDDWHEDSITHPGCSVGSAVLALAERNRHGGTALLRAMVLGYDVGARLTMSMDAYRSLQRGHHPPVFGDLFGAAAAAGALAGLSPECVRYMLSYTAQQASGLPCLLRDLEHTEKAFDIGGMPAHNGVQAALLAAHGFTGVADVFSGDHNFFAVYSPDANLEVLTRELGKTYEVMNTSIKKWSVGAPILSSLDAIETLKRNYAFSASDVERLVIRVGKREAGVVNNRAMPDINIQHLVAVMLLDNTLSFTAAHDLKRMRDPEVVKLKERIELVGSPEMSDPKRRWHGEVELVLRDGRTIKHYTPGAHGTIHKPLTRQEGIAKALDLLAPVLGKRKAELLIDAVWNIEKITDMRKMRSLYRV
ncbi:MAG: MmgE/PrpD family protein [Betaproteobacteria bacterium]|nr:MmgE/PrpD family protein [Betaproteobacteria bacterium]